ncbi:PREDICTED: serine/threonine-protein kinase DCLK3 [Cyphomyrmex costatus]|uniref:serine/threonine-protein kinase DCLK3 n=1 Tax=Cyphomyrmex costatus TaxID=456900 RepID=UPI0008522146|nr:PREDICTED: serine/threonine-protein kinase DCLK3 [Cyphomyrmex costatus]
MSRNTKSHNNKDMRKRSALSFIGGDGSLDVDHVLQSKPWENIKEFEESEAGCIQNVLNDFVKAVTQEKSVEAKEGLLKTIKDSTKKTPRSTKKASTKSSIKDLSMDLPGTSSSTISNIVETNVTLRKNKTLKKQSQFEVSDIEMIPQELSHNIDDIEEEIQNVSEANTKKIINSNKTIIKKEIFQDITNVTERCLQTSTPKKISPKIIKRMEEKKESMVENKKQNTRNSETKSKKNVQHKKIQKGSENTEEQDKSNTNVLKEGEKTNINLENHLEKIIPQKLPHNTNAKKETKKTSKVIAKKNVNLSKKIKEGITQDPINIAEKDLQTSTSKKETSISKKETSKIRKKTMKKEKSTAENKISKTRSSENKSQKGVQHKKMRKKSKNREEQTKSSVNMLEEEKTNVNEKEVNVNLENNLVCNKVNHTSSKNKAENKKAKYKNKPNQLKKKSLKKENSENKLQKSTQLSAMINVRGNNGKNKSILRHPLNQAKMKLHEKKESGIHRIQEVPLEELDLSKEYNVEKTLGEGSFAKVLLATHRTTQTRVVLKAVHQELTSEKDFFREFHYSYHLSPHPNILCSYAVAFKAEKCFVFAQEYAPYGDLAGNVKAGGLNEDACKKIAGQLASALDFIHSKQLAHRDIKLENVLVFAQDMSKVKLCDFGCTKREGILVNKIRCTWVPFQPPEIHEIIKNERYACKRSSDCWQFGIVLFVCLTGNPPWQSADPIQDPDYSAFQRWLKRRTTKIPPTFRRFTPRLLRYFRRAFEHKPEKRPHVTEINKYLKDSWCISKISHSATSTSVDVSESLARRGDSLLYLDTILDDRHNVDENKNKLRKLLNSYGLETTVDQKVVTKRIWEWVMQCDSNIDTEPGLISSFSTENM